MVRLEHTEHAPAIGDIVYDRQGRRHVCLGAQHNSVGLEYAFHIDVALINIRAIHWLPYSCASVEAFLRKFPLDKQLQGE